MTETARWSDEELAALTDGLTAENLAALMRSTWTWDDRALRRDLARVLTGLTAVRELTPGSDIHQLVRGRTLAAASTFLAAVLGPRVVADAGHATSFSFAGTLVRSPRLDGGPRDLALVHALGAATLETLADPVNIDLASLSDTSSREVAAQALSASGDQALGREYLTKIDAGVLTATVAAAEASGSWDPALVATRATVEGSQWILEGEKFFVPHADTADVLLVIARSTAGPSLFAVDGSADGVDVSPMAVIDPTRPLSRLRLDRVPATLIGGEGAGGRLMGRVLDLATVSLAEEQVAGIRKCLELSVAAAKAISGPGSHVPTVLGEVRVQLEVAQVMWEHARRVAGSDTVEGSIAAAMSHISCSIAFSRAAAETVRLVAEADVDAGDEAETLFRRAQSSELLFGGPVVYHERLLERMGI